ncbi:hypothetical protein BGZ76_006934 [Entomortierella beljakovae]|nr:hypothetical protein BGZ76_006934 [Entomortierella beljakovae]
MGFLQMFGNNNNNNGAGRRGPIALTDDDLVGATGIEWEDIEAQLRDGEDEDIIMDDSDDDDDYEDQEELQDMASRPLKPINSKDRYLDDDDEDDEGEEMTSQVNQRYRDDDDDDDDGAHAGNSTGESNILQNQAGIDENQKDPAFKLDDGDSD